MKIPAGAEMCIRDSLKRAAALELQRGKALVQHRAFPLVDEKGAGIHGVADLGVEAGLPVLDRGIGAGHLLLNPEPVAPQFLFEGYIEMCIRDSRCRRC